MKFNVYNTHMEISPYNKGDVPYIEKMFTAVDRHSLKEYPCAYMIMDKILYLPKGAPLHKLESIFGEYKIISENDPYELMSDEFASLYRPRNELQYQSIEFLTSSDTPQLGLNLATGFGKTFCVAYSITNLRAKAIIITPNENLKVQWIDTFSNMFNYRPKNLMNISGSNVMSGIMNNEIEERDVYFVNHQTLRSYMATYGGEALHEFFKRIKVKIKVYDESHLEFGNILLIDYFTNTAKNWYLTATFDRSDRTESACFRKAFSSVSTFGETESLNAITKHVVYHVVNINSHASYKEQRQICGFVGMTTASYAKYAFITDKNDTTYMAIKSIINKLSEIEGKILLFVGLIEGADIVANKLKKDFPNKRIGIYHSKIDKEEKESALKCDIIVSTAKSCGTGKDIKELRAVICAEELASKILAKQIIGRLRPYKDKETFYFDIVNTCIPSVTFWFRSRFKAIEPLVKKIIYLNIDD